jgi:co-chaperonin GroES (HSP10)
VIRPLRDLLVLRPIIDDKLGMVGGLYMPEIGKLSCKTSGVCEVLAAGPKCIAVEKGSFVAVPVYDKSFAGDEVLVGSEKVLMIRERDLIGVLV